MNIGRSLFDWLDDRTGVRSLIHGALYEPVPGGARWRYVWGSTLVACFATQVVTGLFLWMTYSPSTQTAWESVYYLQYETTAGWLLRGIHHFTAHAMVYLLIVHFMQVVIDGAYRAPRELNFVVGVVMMFLVLGMALTGYLLPWDQKGYWATSVGTNLASQAPVLGPDLRKLAIGGSDYGHLTLTRFFALHAGVLPGLLGVLLVAHIALFRRHGLHARNPAGKPAGMFWPDQLLKDAIAALAVLAAVLAATIYWRGAELGAPADPANPYDAARPESYFLFLFQFLKWFPGELEVWGAIVIPTLVVLVILAMPWIARSRAGHVFNVTFLFLLLGGAALLTVQSLNEDNYAAWHTEPDGPSEKLKEKFAASRKFLEAKQQAAEDAERVVELAGLADRIPPTGALAMSYDDPYLQGPRLFKQHCAGCHNHEYDKHIGLEKGVDPDKFFASAHRFGMNYVDVVNPKPTASNLWGVGGRQWILAMLEPKSFVDEDHFGYPHSPFVDGDMATFLNEARGDAAKDDRKKIDEAFLNIFAAIWVEAGTMNAVHAKGVEELESRAKTGRKLITGGLADILDSGTSCVDCHKFYEHGELGSAPDLTGYMSREWMIDFIKNPSAERFYGDNNDRMPAFAPHDDPALNQLDQKSIELIVDWLRGDWPRPPAPKDSQPAK